MLCQIRHVLMSDKVILCIVTIAICRARRCLCAQPRCQIIWLMTCHREICRLLVDYVIWSHVETSVDELL